MDDANQQRDSKMAELDAPLHALGFEIDEVSPSRLTGRLVVTPTCCQPFKVLHGGVSALIAEGLAPNRSTIMSHDGDARLLAGGHETTLGPLGHLPSPPPPPTASSSSTYNPPLPSATLLSPTSISDTITDVSPFIPIVLDLAAHNYYHWCHLFLVHLGRCGLRSHIDAGAPTASSDPFWIKDDFAILQWIYTRISTELFGLLPKDGATASIIWHELQRLFQDNRDARINQLETALRTIKQRDEPVGTYCQRLKAMADELNELGAPVDDRRLISATLAGINERFNTITSVIPLLRPVPPYSEVLSMIQLEEGKMRTWMEQPQAYYTANRTGDAHGNSTPAQQPPQQPAPRPAWQPQHPRPAGVSPNYKGKNPIPGFVHRNATGTSSSTPEAQAPSAPTPTAPAPPPPAPTPTWRAPADPWTGLVQAWPVPWTQGAGEHAHGVGLPPRRRHAARHQPLPEHRRRRHRLRAGRPRPRRPLHPGMGSKALEDGSIRRRKWASNRRSQGHSTV